MFVAEFNDDYRVLLDIPENVPVARFESIIKLYYQKYYKKGADNIVLNDLVLPLMGRLRLISEKLMTHLLCHLCLI